MTDKTAALRQRASVKDGPEVALIRFFTRFPNGSHLGFGKWQDVAETVRPSEPNLDAQAAAVLASDFGAALENLVTSEMFPFKRRLYFSARRKVALAMCKTLLQVQSTFPDRDAL